MLKAESGSGPNKSCNVRLPTDIAPARLADDRHPATLNFRALPRRVQPVRIRRDRLALLLPFYPPSGFITQNEWHNPNMPPRTQRHCPPTSSGPNRQPPHPSAPSLLLRLRPRHLATILLPLLWWAHPPTTATAQVPPATALPQIAPGAVLNAASYAQPITPGAIVSVFGTNLAATTASATATPLPTSLAGTSVTVNGVKAPLFYVSPGQINLQIPWETPFGYPAPIPAPVIVSTAAGASSPASAPMLLAAPSLFSADGSGCGPAAALNIAPDGTVSVNSPSNSAAPGDFISLFGTGFEMVYSPPKDGDVSLGSEFYYNPAGPSLDGNYPWVSKTTLAPGLVGVGQSNFQVPLGTREGCAIPVSIGADFAVSPVLSVSIHTGRGACVDPPLTSYGSITLTKQYYSGNSNPPVTDTLTASFPAGPGVRPPKLLSVIPSAGYDQQYGTVNLSRTCPLPGRSALSAGTVLLGSPSLTQPLTAAPQPGLEGVIYQQSLPVGSIGAGTYTLANTNAAGDAGANVSFQGAITLPPPITVQTPLPLGTKISISQPLVIRWTGGTAGTLVKLMLIAHNGLDDYIDTAYVDASTGSFTFYNVCIGHSVASGGNGVYCSFGLPQTNSASVVLEVSPSSGIAATVNAQGLTQGVQLSWLYRYVFDGLTFIN